VSAGSRGRKKKKSYQIKVFFLGFRDKKQQKNEKELTHGPTKQLGLTNLVRGPTSTSGQQVKRKRAESQESCIFSGRFFLTHHQKAGNHIYL